jgi:hypothetical protein
LAHKPLELLGGVKQKVNGLLDTSCCPAIAEVPMIRLFDPVIQETPRRTADQDTALQGGSPDKIQVAQVANRNAGLTTLEKALIVIIFFSLGVFAILAGLGTGDATVAFVLLSFVLQPFLLGWYARKRYHRCGIAWSLIAFGINVGITVFFEAHMTGYAGTDGLAEIGTALILSTTTVLVILTGLRGDIRSTSGSNFSIRLRNGLFRFWIVGSSFWVIFCALEFYLYCTRYNCKFFVGKTFASTSYLYLDIGLWFTAIPALAFVIGLAGCWAIDGFGIATAKRSENTQPE